MNSKVLVTAAKACYDLASDQMELFVKFEPEDLMPFKGIRNVAHSFWAFTKDIPEQDALLLSEIFISANRDQFTYGRCLMARGQGHAIYNASLEAKIKDDLERRVKIVELIMGQAAA
jgi:hypothetical protein